VEAPEVRALADLLVAGIGGAPAERSAEPGADDEVEWTCGSHEMHAEGGGDDPIPGTPKLPRG
jgi:hypothetical protein